MRNSAQVFGKNMKEWKIKYGNRHLHTWKCSKQMNKTLKQQICVGLLEFN